MSPLDQPTAPRPGEELDAAKLAVASSGEGTIRFYILDLEQLVALAQTRVTRSLTDKECSRLLHVEVCPSEQDIP